MILSPSLAAIRIRVEYNIGLEPVASVVVRVGHELSKTTTMRALIPNLAHVITSVSLPRIKISEG